MIYSSLLADLWLLPGIVLPALPPANEVANDPSSPVEPGKVEVAAPRCPLMDIGGSKANSGEIRADGCDRDQLPLSIDGIPVGGRNQFGAGDTTAGGIPGADRTCFVGLRVRH